MSCLVEACALNDALVSRNVDRRLQGPPSDLVDDLAILTAPGRAPEEMMDVLLDEGVRRLQDCLWYDGGGWWMMWSRQVFHWTHLHNSG